MSGDGTVSWADLLSEATSRLERSGSPTAASDARRIVAEASGSTDTELVLVLREPATERGVAQLDDMLERRAAGEPLQYVLGSWGFRTLDLMVDRRVLIPRPETESVVDVALVELDRVGGRERPTRVLDLGTGSGAIALSIAAERVRTEVWATDASEEALAVATANIAGLGRSGARVRTAHGSWFEALPPELRGSFDLVVSNPPYVAREIPLPADVEDWEPTSALWSGPDGTSDLRHLIANVGPWLSGDAAFVVELSPEQAEPIAALAAQYFREVRVETDLTGRERALVVSGVR